MWDLSGGHRTGELSSDFVYLKLSMNRYFYFSVNNCLSVGPWTTDDVIVASVCVSMTIIIFAFIDTFFADLLRWATGCESYKGDCDCIFISLTVTDHGFCRAGATDDDAEAVAIHSSSG